jgi:hypothetical protein
METRKIINNNISDEDKDEMKNEQTKIQNKDIKFVNKEINEVDNTLNNVQNYIKINDSKYNKKNNKMI